MSMQLDAEPGRVDHVQRPAEMSLARAGVLGVELGQPPVPDRQIGTAADSGS